MMRLKPLTRFDPDNIKEWHKVNIKTTSDIGPIIRYLWGYWRCCIHCTYNYYYLNSLGGANTLLLTPPRGANKHFRYQMLEIYSLYCIHLVKHWLRWIPALCCLTPYRVLKEKFHLNIYSNGLGWFLVLCSLRACRVLKIYILNSGTFVSVVVPQSISRPKSLSKIKFIS